MQPPVGVWVCPFCRANSPPLDGDKVSTGGWALFGVLLVCRLIHMTLADVDHVKAAGRTTLQITDRLAVVVLEPAPDVVLLGVFFDGQLVRRTEEPIGEG